MGADDGYRGARNVVAYQGAPGAFSEDAARALTGAGTTMLPCSTLEAVFAALAHGRAAAAIVPVENTIAGAVPGVADLMRRSRVCVTGEVTMRIAHALIGLPGTSIDRLTRVSSHPVALAQCGRFLGRHPHLAPIAAFDTAGAVADLVRRGDPADAAIASARAAALWGAVVLENEIQDRTDNFTRFVQVTPALNVTSIRA